MIHDTRTGTYNIMITMYVHISHRHSVNNSRGGPGLFYTYFYNDAARLRLEKLLLCLELSRSPNVFFKPLPDPGFCFASETAARRS